MTFPPGFIERTGPQSQSTAISNSKPGKVARLGRDRFVSGNAETSIKTRIENFLSNPRTAFEPINGKYLAQSVLESFGDHKKLYKALKEHVNELHDTDPSKKKARAIFTKLEKGQKKLGLWDRIWGVKGEKLRRLVSWAFSDRSDETIEKLEWSLQQMNQPSLEERIHKVIDNRYWGLGGPNIDAIAKELYPNLTGSLDNPTYGFMLKNKKNLERLKLDAVAKIVTDTHDQWAKQTLMQKMGSTLVNRAIDLGNWNALRVFVLAGAPITPGAILPVNHTLNPKGYPITLAQLAFIKTINGTDTQDKTQNARFLKTLIERDRSVLSVKFSNGYNIEQQTLKTEIHNNLQQFQRLGVQFEKFSK